MVVVSLSTFNIDRRYDSTLYIQTQQIDTGKKKTQFVSVLCIWLSSTYPVSDRDDLWRTANLSCTQDWYALYLAMNFYKFVCFLFYPDRLNHLDQHATALWHSNIWHCCSFFSDWWTVLRSVASYCINEFLLSYGNVL